MWEDMAYRTEMALSQREVLAQVESSLTAWDALELYIVNRAICKHRRHTDRVYRRIAYDGVVVFRSLEGQLDLAFHVLDTDRPVPSPPPAELESYECITDTAEEDMLFYDWAFPYDDGQGWDSETSDAD